MSTIVFEALVSVTQVEDGEKYNISGESL